MSQRAVDERGQYSPEFYRAKIRAGLWSKNAGRFETPDQVVPFHRHERAKQDSKARLLAARRAQAVPLAVTVSPNSREEA